MKLRDELQELLLTSNDAQRRAWAKEIIEEQIDLAELCQLLNCERPIAMRFLWLLSDLGETDKDALAPILPYLFKRSDTLEHIDIKPAFAKYWSLCGIPAEHETEAIDLLFEFLQSASYNVTIKGHAMMALFGLTQKYPELGNELKISLEDQLDKNTANFRKRIEKVLAKLSD